MRSRGSNICKKNNIPITQSHNESAMISISLIITSVTMVNNASCIEFTFTCCVGRRL